VRKAALSSLISLYPEECEDRLLEAMTDRDPGLRTWAKGELEKRITAPAKARPRQKREEGRR
jgi:hypothetical protein